MSISKFLPTLFLSLFLLTQNILPVRAANTSTDFTSVTSSNDPTVQKTDGSYEQAIVRKTEFTSTNTDHGGQQQKTYTIEFLTGPLKNKLHVLSNEINANPYNLNPDIGDRVVILLQVDPTGGPPLAYLEGYDRRVALLWLAILFVFTLVLLAGWQGAKVAFSIAISIALIVWVLIPSFLHGLNPVAVAGLLSVVLTGISGVLSTGWNKKTFVNMVGTLGGVIVAYAISSIFSSWAHLGGLSTEDDRIFFEKNPLLNPTGLMFAGIIIASMGVVEDVAVSITSGVWEVLRANHRLRVKELFRSGMVVGRDHMSALANTLIFAYVGASLSTLLLYSQYGGSWLKFLNFDSVVDEVIRSLSGTIGLIFTVPITALLAAVIASRSLQAVDPIRQATTWKSDRAQLNQE